MSTTPIPSIPYNGGTINIVGGENIFSVALSPTKIVNFYGQKNPNIIYATVVTVDGLEGGSVTSTNGPQYAFGSSDDRVRAWRMSDTRLFVMFGRDLRVMEIGADDEITLKNAILPNFGPTYLWGNMLPNNTLVAESADGMSMGTYIQAKRFSDTKALFVTRNASQTDARVVTYDAAQDALSASSTRNIYSSGWSGSHSEANLSLQIADIPGSSNKLVYITRAGDSGYRPTTARNAADVGLDYAAIINDSNSIVRTLGGIPRSSTYNDANPNIQRLIPLSETKFIGICDAGRAKIYSETGFGNVVTFATDGRLSLISDAVMLDDTYFMIAATADVPVTEHGGNATMRENFLRIVRYVDDTFMEVTPFTATLNYSLGKPLTPDGNVLTKIGPFTVFTNQKTNSVATDASVTIKSIYGGN